MSGYRWVEDYIYTLRLCPGPHTCHFGVFDNASSEHVTSRIYFTRQKVMKSPFRLLLCVYQSCHFPRYKGPSRTNLPSHYRRQKELPISQSTCQPFQTETTNLHATTPRPLSMMTNATRAKPYLTRSKQVCMHHDAWPHFQVLSRNWVAYPYLYRRNITSHRFSSFTSRQRRPRAEVHLAC